MYTVIYMYVSMYHVVAGLAAGSWAGRGSEVRLVSNVNVGEGEVTMRVPSPPTRV